MTIGTFSGAFEFGHRGMANNSQPYNGALLYVDAAQSASYSGSGTTWTDLSTNANNGTITGSPTYTSAYGGYFTFNGAGSQYVTTVASEYNTTFTGKTVIVVARMSASAWTNGVDQFRGLFGTASGSRNFNTYVHRDSSNNYQLHYSAGGAGGFSNNLSITTGQWYVFAVTHTTGGLVSYYLNGQPVGTNTGITFSQYVSGQTENIGLCDNYWYGDIGVCAVYGRALQDTEILQSYNTIKTRFGYTTLGLQLQYNPAISSSYPGSGTTVNSLVSPNLTGTMSNITYTSPYFAYNGTSSTLSVADDAALEPGTGDFTVEAWVYYSVLTGSTRTFLSKADNGGLASSWSYGFRTNGTTGAMYMEVGNGTTSATSPSYTVTTGTWYHVVGVYTNVASKSIALYINSVSQGSNLHSFTSVKNSTNPLYFGSYNGGEYSQWLNGRIGIVSFYNRALTGNEIATNYQVSKGTYGL